jgi:hypothetical protein
MGGEVADEFDSKQCNEPEFVDLIVAHLAGGHSLAIEDIPPLYRFDLPAKKVCLLQGRILQRCEDAVGPDKAADLLTWIQPSRWLHHHGWRGKKKSGSTAAYAKEKCAELGYTPPEHSRGSKLLQDYRDAYLLAVAARDWQNSGILTDMCAVRP